MKRVLLISDMHTGSCCGLIPRKAVVEGMHITPNRHQKQLLAGWEDMCKNCGPLDVAICNGDLIDGPQRLEDGKFVVTTDFVVQCEWAAQLLNMIPANKFYLTRGTDYHSVRGVCSEEYIATILREKYQRRAVYKQELKVKIGKAIIVANHHIGVSTSWYRATAIARDLLLYDLNLEEYGPVNLVVRSHAHYFVQVDFGSKTGVVTPCWQIRSSYATKKNLVSPTKIGYLIAEINDDCDELTIDIRKKFYKVSQTMEEEVYNEKDN